MSDKQALSFELAKEVGEIHIIDRHPYMLTTIDNYPSFTRFTFRDYTKVFLETQMLKFPGAINFISARSLFENSVFKPDVKIEKLKYGSTHIYREMEE